MSMPSDFAIALRRFGVPVLILLTALPGLAGDWNPKLAAQYLDSRQKEWFDWGPAKRTGGPCISCHTGATYLLARPALRRALGETEPVIRYSSKPRSVTAGAAASMRAFL